MKTALITGCNRGLGEGIRNVLLNEGYRVIGLNRTLSNNKIENYIEIQCDISKNENVVKAKEMIKDNIDLLVINAGIRRFEKVENIQVADWEDSVNINLNGAFYVLKTFMEEVKQAKGDIVVIGSHSEKYAFETGSAYCSTKLALRGLTECLREEVRYDDVRVSYLSLRKYKKQKSWNERRMETNARRSRNGNAKYYQFTKESIYSLCGYKDFEAVKR